MTPDGWAGFVYAAISGVAAWLWWLLVGLVVISGCVCTPGCADGDLVLVKISYAPERDDTAGAAVPHGAGDPLVIEVPDVQKD